MKILCLFLLVATSAFAQLEERVVRVIKTEKHDLTMTLEEKSFEPNINGYACPWPGLRLPSYAFDYWTNLNHGRQFFDKDVVALKEGELDHEFCDWPTPADVFGEEFVLGKEIKLKVEVEQVVVEMEADGDDGKELYIRETMSTRFGGRNLESKAYMQIENN